MYFLRVVLVLATAVWAVLFGLIALYSGKFELRGARNLSRVESRVLGSIFAVLGSYLLIRTVKRSHIGIDPMDED